MFKAIQRFYRMIYPPFLKNWEDWMLVRYPALWGMALPAILFFGSIMNLMAVAFVWVFPMDLDSLPNVEFWTIFAFIIGVICMIVWMVGSAKFDPAVYYGERKTVAARLRPFMYLLAVAFLLGPSGTIYFQFNIRIGWMIDSEDLQRDLAVVLNYDDFKKGSDVGSTKFLNAVRGTSLVDTAAPLPVEELDVDTNQILSKLFEIEAKYDGKHSTRVKSMKPGATNALNLINQQQTGPPNPTPENQTTNSTDAQFNTPADGPVARDLPQDSGMVMDQSDKDGHGANATTNAINAPVVVQQQSQQVVQGLFFSDSMEVTGISPDTSALRRNFSKYSVISNDTKANLDKLQKIMDTKIHEDWLNWLLFMAVIGVVLALFISLVEFSARYLGGWYGIVLVAGGLLGFLVLLVSGAILSPLAESVLQLFFPPDPVTGQSSLVTATMTSLFGGLPMVFISTAFLHSMVLKRIKKGSKRLPLLMAISAGMFFTLVVVLLVSFANYGVEGMKSWPYIGMPMMFLGSLLVYSLLVPYLKNRFYAVYLLPK